MIIDVSEDGYTVTWESLVTGTRKSATIVQLIEAFEAEPIVRCKDCKHWGGETHGCEKHSSVEPWWETDFCNYGERKDEVEE